MTFTEPMPFEEALDFAQEKQLLPTHLTSAELRDLHAALKRRSVFSARLAMADQLDLLGKLTGKIAGGMTEGGAVAGKHTGTDRMLSIPEAKAQLLESFERAGWSPKNPADIGTIKDFRTDARLQLMTETNVMDTLGFGQWQSGQDEVALDVNPALELIRVRAAKMPRNWEERWEAARAATSEEGSTDAASGRMVALKNHPLWQALGNGEGGYKDTLGNPWAPFAFSSGMGTMAVSRPDAMALGLLGETTRIPAERRDLNRSLEVSAARFDQALQKQLAADPALMVRGGVLALRNRAGALRSMLVLSRDLANSRHYERDHLGRFATDGAPLSPRQNISRGTRAVRHAMRHGQDIPNAMHVRHIGQIDFLWGRPGTSRPDARGVTHTDGYGLSHIVAKHGRAALLKLPTVLANGAVRPHPTEVTKREVTLGNWLAVMKQKPKAASFVVTNFDQTEGKKK